MESKKFAFEADRTRLAGRHCGMLSERVHKFLVCLE